MSKGLALLLKTLLFKVIYLLRIQAERASLMSAC